MSESVVIIYYSGYGHTEKQAEAVAAGALEVAGVVCTLIPVASLESADAEGWHTVDAASAVIFGSPTYMGSAAAEFKKFMEASSGRWMAGKWQDKLAAGFTNSGSHNGDKQNTLVEFVTFAAQHGMVWINLNLAPGNNSSAGSINDLNRLGASLGAMAQSNVDVGPDEGPIASDLETAKSLGRRVGQSTLRWNT